MGISLIDLDKNQHLIGKSNHKIINVFCGFASIGGLFLLLIAPDSINPKINKIGGSIALLGGVCSGISLIVCGSYLQGKERVANAIGKQELELFQHQLALSRVFFEKQREQTVLAVLEGSGDVEEYAPPIAAMPIPELSQYQQTKPTLQSTELPTDNSFEGRKKQLWELIQTEAEWLGKLLKRKPLLVVGPQGSGKTTFVKFLALLRSLYLNHQIQISDPHAHNNDWLANWEVVGGNYDYKAIDKALKGYFDRLKSSKIPTTSIWDECTNYAENCQSSYAERFLKSVLADCRKSTEYPILLSHGETLSNLGGGKGGANKMKDEGLTTLKLLREADSMGEDKPAFRGYLSGLDYEEDGKPISYSVELHREWMNPGYLLKLFPELAPQIDSNSDNLDNTKNNIINTETGRFDLGKKPDNSQSLEDLESEIFEFCKNQKTATVREIQNKFKSVGIKANTIKAILSNFESRGLGSVTVKKVGGAESVGFTIKDT